MDNISIDLLHVAMNISQAEHKVASSNIASFDITGVNKKQVDFSHLLKTLENTNVDDKAQLINQIKSEWKQIESSAISSLDGEIKLDKETADVLLSSGKYKLLADALNRKLGLMKLAVSGGKR